MHKVLRVCAGMVGRGWVDEASCNSYYKLACPSVNFWAGGQQVSCLPWLVGRAWVRDFLLIPAFICCFPLYLLPIAGISACSESTEWEVGTPACRDQDDGASCLLNALLNAIIGHALWHVL